MEKTTARQNVIDAMRRIDEHFAEIAEIAKKAHGKNAAELYAALKQVRIIPDGSGDPLPVIPDEVVVTEADLDDISEAWDQVMPEYAGMLDATVERRQNA